MFRRRAKEPLVESPEPAPVPVVDHRMYYYHQHRGTNLLRCAKCKCGAEMVGPDEVGAHEKLLNR